VVAVLKYGGSFSSTETQLISFRIVDTLYQPMLLNAVISNPNGAISTRYSPYDEIEIVETTSVLGETTNLILFRGKIENISIPTHPKYGQVIELNARDNLQELAKRTMRDGTYSASGRGGTSGLLKEIIEDHTATATNIDITNASTLLASTNTNARSATFKSSGSTALRVITEEAQADPWGATSGAADNSGFAFYLDSALDFNYHKLGTVPSAPASNGLTVQYGLTAPTITAQPMLAGSSFNEPGRQAVTHCNALYTDRFGAPHSILLQRFTHGTVTNSPFYAGISDSDNLGGARLVGAVASLVGRVQYVEDGAILVSHVDGEDANDQNMPPLWVAGETVTQQAGPTTGSQPFANITTTPFLKMGMMVEKTVQGYDFVDTSTDKEGRTKAIEAAATVLRKGFAVEGLVEGTLKIIGYPEHRQSSTWYQVRAGQQIKVTNTGTANINDNMTVKRIQYEQGPGRMDSTIDVVSVTEGNDYTTSSTSSVARVAVGSGQRTTGAIGQIPAALAGDGGPEASIHISPQAGSNVRTSVSWLGGFVTYTDGFAQPILSGQSDNSTYLNAQFSDTLYPATGAAASNLPYVMYANRDDAQPDLMKMAATVPTGSIAGTTATTLATGIMSGTTTIVLASGSSFSAGNLVLIGDELIKLGSKSTNTFSGCVRAQAGSTRTKANPHQAGVAVTLKVLTYDGTFVCPEEVFGTGRVVIAYVSAGSLAAGTGSTADPAKIFMTSSTSFGNQVTE